MTVGEKLGIGESAATGKARRSEEKARLFDLLSNSRRRWVLQYLWDHSTGGLDDVSEYVAAHENSIDRDRLSSEERKRTYIGLYQIHLPRLDDADLIDFDKERGEVAIGDRGRFETALEWLEVMWALEPKADAFEIDLVFDCLANRRRQLLLEYLMEHDGTAGIQPLARYVASHEKGVDPDDLTVQDEKRSYVALYQTHLPKLHGAGLINWDEESGDATLVRTDALLHYLVRESFGSVTARLTWLLWKVRRTSLASFDAED